MEKKTIGKFISVLRKSNGMTQKELGERLFVSDKTVSRWECDECTPELSLVPSIAEIFGVTTDVIRTAEGKKPSVIIDVIVTMANDDSVLQKEGKRTKFIAQHAINYEEVREKFLNYGVDIDAD